MGFTGGFMNIMYKDNSLFAATRQRVGTPSTIKIHVNQCIRDIEKLEQRERKRKILSIFKDKFGISLNCSRLEQEYLSEEQLFIRLRQKQLVKNEGKAIIII